MNFESFGGRGITIVLLTGIWAVTFLQNGGFPLLWGAMTGSLVVGQ